MKLCRAISFAMLLANAAHAQSAPPPCRQALALGLDVSGSVDAREYRLQLDGLAKALTSPPVQSALLAQPQTPVRIAVYEWSGPDNQHIIAPWTTISKPEDIDHLAQILLTTQRRDASPGTALGHAMGFGVELLEQTRCWTKTLDISGDGESNLGPRPRDIKPTLASRNVTINALVIGSNDAVQGNPREANASQLTAYFQAEVILGKDAFVETSLGFSGYGNAMTRKLLREVEVLQLSSR
jgi:hypothetical protein